MRCEQKIAVLGEMLELGDHARWLHDECGRAAAAAGLTKLFAIGGDPARALAEAAIAAGAARISDYFPQSTEAVAPIAAQVRRGAGQGFPRDALNLVADRLAAEFA